MERPPGPGPANNAGFQPTVPGGAPIPGDLSKQAFIFYIYSLSCG